MIVSVFTTLYIKVDDAHPEPDGAAEDITINFLDQATHERRIHGWDLGIELPPEIAAELNRIKE
jgi:hypothetical protein